mgnify:CR=1 FL=1
MEIEKSDGLPRRMYSKERPDYRKLAEEMELDDKVKTGGRAETEGLIRALDRRGYKGARRLIDGEYWVWRTE